MQLLFSPIIALITALICTGTAHDNTYKLVTLIPLEKIFMIFTNTTEKTNQFLQHILCMHAVLCLHTTYSTELPKSYNCCNYAQPHSCPLTYSHTDRTAVRPTSTLTQPQDRVSPRGSAAGWAGRYKCLEEGVRELVRSGYSH
ncbi:hypothetical protein COO60DRAFT_1227806 [Scenedesmus sp. NREL 46B-D3]|nr:hypothetical protein COO60DRAFT_1227806 [Scenedesmus sp. NREL 46B-D3]